MIAATAILDSTPGMADDGYRLDELKQLAFEDLMELEVTTLSRREEKIDRAAAAVYVVTGEDIRRSGATSLPEALRLVPGVEVGRIDSHTWAISIRGFNSETANKLLVLIDGRSVYTPLYSGVFWDVQDVLLEDVDRIEVIAGPGGSLWGANAVNGVVNVITKSAEETAGGLVQVARGSEASYVASTRYGTRLGKGWIRTWVKAFDREASRGEAGARFGDDWRMARAGFRLDRPGATGALTVQGDIYDGRVGRPSAGGGAELGGGNLLGRWTQEGRQGGELSFQTYLDRTERDIAGTFGEERNTLDLDFQHNMARRGRHDLIWGAGYRVSRDVIENSDFIRFEPDNRTDNLFSAFVQDAIRLRSDRVSLTLGTKLEHNDYTGFEIQPSVRLAFHPSLRQTFWTSLSRAVRTPTRLDADLILTARINLPSVPLPVQIIVAGSDDFRSEEVVSWEAGWKVQLGDRVSLDLAGFYNQYDELRSQEAEAPIVILDPTDPRIELPNRLANGLSGTTTGTTLSVLWVPRPGWRFEIGYSFLEIDLQADRDSVDVSTADSIAGSSPDGMASVEAYLDLRDDLELFAHVRYVDELPEQGVDEILALDLGLTWRPTSRIEISVVGRDLFEEKHAEFDDELRVEPSVVGQLSWRF
jgi:iron complex outermembrane receptor protein